MTVPAVLITFHLVCAGWLLFRADSLGQAGDMFALLAAPRWSPDHTETLYYLLHFAWPAIVFQCANRWIPQAFRATRAGSVSLILAAYALLHVVIEGRFGHVRQFIYFQF